MEEGHREGGAVVGKKAGKDTDCVLHARQMLTNEYGEKSSQAFKTIPVDNGAEFSGFASIENWGSRICFAPPHTAWEHPQNERRGRKQKVRPEGCT